MFVDISFRSVGRAVAYNVRGPRALNGRRARTESHQDLTDVLIMHFSKAFDKVSHGPLVHKLDHYGIRGKTNTWIQNFLSDRSQAVVVDGEKYSYIDVAYGVPQGSVLVTSLFLFYINDL